MEETSSISVLIVSIIVAYISWLYYQNKDHEYVEAKDGRSYRVQDTDDKEKSANLLADVIKRCNLLVKHLEKMEPDDIRTKTLLDRFNPSSITENNPDEARNGVTSYTVNKGDNLVVCLRQRDGNLVDINTLMYVVVHELGHICDLKSEQHDERFWRNFEWLLNHAINIGVYVYEDYGEKHKPYCGISITSNVVD